MAGPKVHAVPTLILTALAAIFCTPLALLSENSLILILVLFLGLFMDLVDHLSIRRIKKILCGEKEPVPGWVNWMHTWWACLGVLCVSTLLGSVLPFLSYAIHVVIDGGDRSNLKYSGSAPLPEFLHQFYPAWAKYETGLII